MFLSTLALLILVHFFQPPSPTRSVAVKLVGGDWTGCLVKGSTCVFFFIFFNLVGFLDIYSFFGWVSGWTCGSGWRVGGWTSANGAHLINSLT